MTKKVKHAQEPAGSKPETVLEDQSAAGVEQEAPALVEGDGGAASLGTEQPGGQAGTDDGSAGSWLGDADVPYGAGPDAAVAQAAASDGAEQDDAAAADPDKGLTPFQILYRDDKHFPAAIEAAGRSLEVALRILDPDPEKSLSDIAYAHENLNGSAFAEAANFMRQIGHARATVEVVATQLRLSGHRDDRPVTGAERVALEVFLFTLASLDGFAKAEADRRAREEEEKNRKPAPKTPIDETTMEPVDGPMATWGAR